MVATSRASRIATSGLDAARGQVAASIDQIGFIDNTKAAMEI